MTWHEERCLRTWIYCYNADRHVSVRLGRNAVIQACAFPPPVALFFELR